MKRVDAQTGLSFYEIVNNPKLLRQMTVEAGQDLTTAEQITKLYVMMKAEKIPGAKPPDILA